MILHETSRTIHALTSRPRCSDVGKKTLNAVVKGIKSEMFSLDETFELLTDSVSIDSASDLVKECKRIGMTQIAYVDTGMDSTLPEFDNGYNFIYKTNDGVETRLEILEKDSLIMQLGVQIVYPLSFFFSKAIKHFNILKGLCNDYYGESLPMNIGDAKILNYGNSLSVCYLSRLKVNGRCVINFKVGNRKFW